MQVKCEEIHVKCEEMQQYATKCIEMQRNASYMHFSKSTLNQHWQHISGVQTTFSVISKCF